MKIYSLILAYFICCHITVNAQNNTKISQVIYKKSVYEKRELKMKNAEMKKMMEKVEDINDRMEYNLFFNDTKSYYKMKKIMDIDEDSPLYKLAVGTPNEFYMDIESADFIKYSQILGKPFNVQINNNKYNWKITTETKKIGDYTCYKAIGSYEEYNAISDSNNSFTPIVWFTNEIPVPFGPEDFNGLPGLVLEASLNGQTFFYAEKIELKKIVDKKNIISKPKAEEISEKKYLELISRNFHKS